jgi:hypothetical protein
LKPPGLQGQAAQKEEATAGVFSGKKTAYNKPSFGES